MEPGRLRLVGRESIVSNFQVTLLARRQREPYCTAETELIYAPSCPEHVAGLAYLYNNENFYLLVKSAEDTGAPQLIVWRCRRASKWEELQRIPLPPHDRLGLRVEADALQARFCYALDGGEWRPAGSPMTAPSSRTRMRPALPAHILRCTARTSPAWDILRTLLILS